MSAIATVDISRWYAGGADADAVAVEVDEGLQRAGFIVVTGGSAGGHLAVSTATNFEQRAYEPNDEVDQVSCRPDFAIAVYSGGQRPLVWLAGTHRPSPRPLGDPDRHRPTIARARP